MAGSDENAVVGRGRTSNTQGVSMVGAAKFTGGIRRSRRALSTINHLTAAPYPCAVSKPKPMPEKNESCSKNLQIPVVHRPMTRRLAAELAIKKKEVLVEEIEQLVPSLPETNEQKDCPVIDVDEYWAKKFPPNPELMQVDDPMVEEVEMEDVDEELLLDIDSGDKRDPLCVVEYIDDLYAQYKKMESCVPASYMSIQFDINERMRGILIDWLIEVHNKFEFLPESLYLTVNLIDRFLAIEPVARKKLQLVGVAAMLLACKYEEVSVPVVEDLILLSDMAYTRTEILEMEALMLNKLQFNLSVPTAYVFMRRFLKAAQSDNKLELLAFYIIELCLVEYEMVRFPPSILAAAAIFTAQCALGKASQWSKTSERHTNYTEHELMECSKLMVEFHSKAVTGRLTGVYRKYSTSKYGHVARTEPAHFLLES